MYRDIIWKLLFLVVMGILFFYVFPNLIDKNSGCGLHDDIYRLRIESRIEKKFVDTPNHNLKKIIYRDSNNNKQELFFSPEFKNMYDSISVGDSIVKLEKTLYFKVIAGNSRKFKLFKFYTMCHDSIKSR